MYVDVLKSGLNNLHLKQLIKLKTCLPARREGESDGTERIPEAHKACKRS